MISLFLFFTELSGLLDVLRAQAPPTAGKIRIIQGTGPTEGMVLVPAGSFLMGSNEASDQMPVRRLWLPAFWIDRTEVTAGAFDIFLKEKNLFSPKSPLWDGESLKPELKNHPAFPVPWELANEFCRFHGKRLPSEAQWEKAARGPAGWKFPWGNDWNNTFCNNGDQNVGRKLRSRPVGGFPEGTSHYGALDMAGNVREWVRDFYEPNAYQKTRLTIMPIRGEAPRVLRGGSFNKNQQSLSTHHRSHSDIDPELSDFGFRCVMDE